MAISEGNDRRSVTLPKILWDELETAAERVKRHSGQKVTVSEVIQQTIQDALAQGEPEEPTWVRRVDQLTRDVEQLRAEVSKEFQAMHVRLTCWVEELRQGWPSGALLGQTSADTLRAQYRASAGGEVADPFAPEMPDPVSKRKGWWRRG